MANAITASGAAFKNTAGNGATTVSVTPAALGNAVVLGVDINSTTISAASVAGGGCTGWGSLGRLAVSGLGAAIELWLGTVTSGVGTAQTITVTGSASLTSTAMALIGQQFTTGGGSGTTWATDGAAGTKSNASSTTVAFPTLTASATLRAYVGFGLVQQTGSSTGQTSGYTLALDGNACPLIYNPSVGTTAQSPTATQSPAGTSGTLAVLLTGTNPGAASQQHGAFFPFM